MPGNVITPTRAAVIEGSLLTDQSSMTVFASSDSAISARVVIVDAVVDLELKTLALPHI